MTLAETFTSRPGGRAGASADPNLREPRAFAAPPRAHQLSLALPKGKRIELHTDRVRARPAVTPTISGTIGQTAIALGVAGLFFPHAVKRMLGVRAPAPVVQSLFGLREMWSGYSLVGDPTKSEVLWARVAGDVFDILALKALDNPSNPKRGNARAALGFVLAVTALDVITATRMTNVKRNCE